MPYKKRDKYFNPSKMLTQVLLVSGKKPNPATSLNVGLKLEPSGLQKRHEFLRESMEGCFFCLGLKFIHLQKKRGGGGFVEKGGFNGRQTGLMQELNLSHTH